MTDTPDGGLFELGRLHGRMASLESRVDKQEAIMSGMDKKLDDVLLALASAVGGRDKIRVMMRYMAGVVTAIGTVIAIVVALAPYLTVGIHR